MSEHEQAAITTKTCPACAEEVRAEAIVCRFCGYDFHTKVMGGARPTTNGFAVASLVLGIVWLWWIGSVLAIIFGSIAIGQINRSNGRQTGKGMAVAGLVLGIVGVASIAALFAVGMTTSVELRHMCISTAGSTVCP